METNDYLNQDALEHWDVESLWIYRQNTLNQIAKLSVFLAQTEHALRQKGEM